jgi:ferric-dicitrate binding protein FerR (iron transport regulator)
MDASMMPETAAAEAEALEWVIRVQESKFAEWDALSDWLAEEPRHSEIFQRLTLLDDAIATVLADDALALASA